MAEKIAKSEDKKKLNISESRELKPGITIVGLGKPYIAGGKRSQISEVLIKKYSLGDHLFIGGPDSVNSKKDK